MFLYLVTGDTRWCCCTSLRTPTFAKPLGTPPVRHWSKHSLEFLPSTNELPWTHSWTLSASASAAPNCPIFLILKTPDFNNHHSTSVSLFLYFAFLLPNSFNRRLLVLFYQQNTDILVTCLPGDFTCCHTPAVHLDDNINRKS